MHAKALITTALTTAAALLSAQAAHAAAPIKVNFQPAGATVPAGYVADTGQAFTTARGYGWVRQDSLSSTHVPFDMTGRMRERNLVSDQRQDTHSQPQTAPGSTPLVAAAWEDVVPNGTYTVTVGVGDAQYLDSTHRARVEGVVAINAFTPTSANRFATATVTVTVSDGRLTLDGIGGTNVKFDFIDIAPSGAADTTPPAAPTGLSAAAGSGTVGLTWTANTESDLAGYDLYRATTSPVPVTGAPLNGSTRLTGTSYTDATVANGTTYRYALVAIDAAGNRSARSAEVGATPVNAPASGNLRVTNLDGVPFDDRLVFNRIGSLTAPPDNGVHDRGTARLTNTGSTPLTISSLPITGPFQLLAPPTLPAVLAPGASLDVAVRFTASSGRISEGTLTVRSTDATTPARLIQLSGVWQRVSEGGVEPTLQEIVNVFGYRTTIANTGQTLDRAGQIEAIGEEVLSPYWERLNTGQGVGVRQLAAFHTQGNVARISTYPRGTRTLRPLVTHAGVDGQSLLPHLNGSTTAPASTTFTPSSTQFGFTSDSAWSDPLLNYLPADRLRGCVTGCGHHARFWPAEDRAGVVIPGAYLMTMDYTSLGYTNFDFQDNVYLLTNIKPVALTRIPRVDFGATTNYTDTQGRVWTADTGLFGPPTAPVEGAGTTAIANTDDDQLYRTYRGNPGDVAQADKYFEIRIPEPGMTTATVTLHFAERYWSGPGRRVFDILVEGSERVADYDIFAAAGAANRATTVVLPDIPIRDGSLDIALHASVDNPSIAGFEVACTAGC